MKTWRCPECLLPWRSEALVLVCIKEHKERKDA